MTRTISNTAEMVAYVKFTCARSVDVVQQVLVRSPPSLSAMSLSRCSLFINTESVLAMSAPLQGDSLEIL